jgi:hypothetical protein
MKVLFRVEHPETGLGPYHHTDDNWGGSSSFWNLGLQDHESSNLPSPRRELIDLGRQREAAYWCLNTSKYKSCFVSVEQLKNWFVEGEIEEMRRAGFQLAVVRASETIETPKQALYALDSEESKIYHPLTAVVDFGELIEYNK